MSKHSARRHPASRNNRRQAIAAKTARPKEATIDTNRKPDDRSGFWDGPLALIPAPVIAASVTLALLIGASWGTRWK